MKSLVELTSKDCRWVYEEPSQQNHYRWMYCAAEVKSSTCAYCADHHKVMFEPIKPKKKKVVPNQTF